MTELTDSPRPHNLSAETAPAELPPVEPPSAGFILQLFVIPAVIVAVLIVVVALFGKLAEGKQDPSEYVEAIRSDNTNVQWRAAYELANLIQNEPKLAQDAKLLGKLSSLLEQELDKKDANPKVAQFLAAALGLFETLDARDSSGKVRDPLATLSSALKSGRPQEVRLAAAESLARQAARANGTLESPTAITTLEQAAESGEPSLRERAVYALGFFGGEEATQFLRSRSIQDHDRFVRYNAAIALARRGDAAAADVLREMLSSKDLEAVLKSPNDAETHSRVESVQTEALRALQASLKANAQGIARQLKPEIARLAKSELVTVRLEAETLLKNLQVSN
jgi:hypothetical protein